MNATPMRRAATEQIVGIRGAFLRCDRGESLYATNAQARAAAPVDWARVGFEARQVGGVTLLTPRVEWIARFEAWAEAATRQRQLTDAIQNACFGEIEDEDVRLWIDGVKRLEMRGDVKTYEKAVRQRAAACLRRRRGGGALRACALIVDLMGECEKNEN